MIKPTLVMALTTFKEILLLLKYNLKKYLDV